MKSKLLIAAIAVAMVGCSGSKLPEASNKAAEAEDATLSLTDGKWRLADFAGETEMVDLDSIGDFYLTFQPDSTFGMSTDCNSIGGEYTLAPEDSIAFTNVTSTLMACPSEVVEASMKRILPMIDTYAITPDSVLMLRSDMRTMVRLKHVE